VSERTKWLKIQTFAGWSLRILNKLFEATHKIFVPHKVIRSQRVFIISTLVVVEGPPYSPGAIPVNHFMGFFLGRITLVCLGSGKGAELGDSGEVGVAAYYVVKDNLVLSVSNKITF